MYICTNMNRITKHVIQLIVIQVYIQNKKKNYKLTE